MVITKIEKAINEQINRELYSAYLYLAMAAYAYTLNLKGFAHWLELQAKEETTHADKMYDYLIDQGARVVLKAIDEPPKDFKSPEHIFEATLEHEKKVTKHINELVDLAKKENDHATEIFLQWFVTEQIEEEANASEILQKIIMTGGKGNGLLMLDHQLGKRGAE